MNLPQDLAHQTGAPQYMANGSYLRLNESIIFGSSPRMLAVRAKLKAVADSNLPVLLEGESGTGKITIARLLHQWSAVSNGSFVHVSCPAIRGTLLETELFGYDKGASSNNGGQEQGAALFTLGGTLCLDQVSELDFGLQAKLLQVLQNGKFCPINSSRRCEADIRVVCATNRDLENEVAAGVFRQDLFYRINVVKLELPPLRERIVDLPVLCSYFLELYGREFRCSVKPLSSALLVQLQQYHWPGNIRQLENLIKRYVVMGSEDVFESEMAGKVQPVASPEVLPQGATSLQHASREVRRTFERQLILKALEANQWNRRRAARALKISYRALLYKLKESHGEMPV